MKNYEEVIQKYSERLENLTKEYDNYRKRTVEEKNELVKNGGSDILSAILPAIDDLERAMKKPGDFKTFKQGVGLAYIKLIKALQGKGVKIMYTKNQKFNPELHEAIGVSSAGEDGQILECVKNG